MIKEFLKRSVLHLGILKFCFSLDCGNCSFLGADGGVYVIGWIDIMSVKIFSE